MKKFVGTISEHKAIILIGLLELVYVTGYAAIWFILPILAEEITNDVSLVGLLIAFPTVISIFLAIPIGGFTDKVGRKKPMLIGALLIMSASFLLPQIRSIHEFLFFGLFFGLIHQLFNTPIKAYIMDIAPLKKTAEYFGVYSSAFSIGLMSGSAAGGVLLANNLAIGIVSISQFYIIAGLAAFVMILTLDETVSSSIGKPVRIKEIFQGDQIVARSLLEYKKLGAIAILILYLTFIIYFCPGMTWTLEPLFYTLGMDSSMVGFILVMFVLPLVLFAIPAGWLADKYGKTRMIIPGLFIGGIFLIIFGITNDAWILLGSAFISSVGFAFVWSSANGLLADISSGHQKGGIAGVWNIFEDLGYVAGPIFGGFVADMSGDIKIPFILLGIIVLVSILPVVLVTKKALREIKTS